MRGFGPAPASRYHVADLFDEASDWGTPHIDVCFDQFGNAASCGDVLVQTLSRDGLGLPLPVNRGFLDHVSDLIV